MVIDSSQAVRSQSVLVSSFSRCSLSSHIQSRVDNIIRDILLELQISRMGFRILFVFFCENIFCDP